MVDDGLRRGREAAVEELKAALNNALVEGRELGRQEGLAQLRIIADTLRAALAANEQVAGGFTTEAEHFCIELALATIAKLAEVDDVRTDFIQRSIKAALTKLGPNPPIAILVHPGAAEAITAAFPDLPIHGDTEMQPGQVRIDGGRLLVETAISDALAAIRESTFTVGAQPAGRPDEPLMAKEARSAESSSVRVAPSGSVRAQRAKKDVPPTTRKARSAKSCSDPRKSKRTAIKRNSSRSRP